MAAKPPRTARSAGCRIESRHVRLRVLQRLTLERRSCRPPRCELVRMPDEVRRATHEMAAKRGVDTVAALAQVIRELREKQA